MFISRKRLGLLVLVPLLMVNRGDAQTDLNKEVTSIVNGTADRQDQPFKTYRTNTKTMYSSRRDLLTFYLFIKYLKEYDKPNDLKLVEEYAREFISKRIDPLLTKEIRNDDPEERKVLLELQYLKASLFYECSDVRNACMTLKKLDDQYHEDINIDVGFMGNVFQQKKPYMALTLFKHACKETK